MTFSDFMAERVIARRSALIGVKKKRIGYLSKPNNIFRDKNNNNYKIVKKNYDMFIWS